MTFLPESRRIIKAEGSPEAKICIVGEAGGAEEDRLLLPFKGPSGTVLDQCLHAAGMLRGECYITNVVKIRPRANDISPFFNDRTGTFSAEGRDWCEILYEELKDVRANVIVPLGKVALAACAGTAKIAKFRGYVLEGNASVGNRKVIPAYHPAASLRGQYILRYYITADLKKAKLESAFPDIRRPDRKIIIPTTLTECFEWLDYLDACPSWSCDIEVVNFEVSAIGFGPKKDLAISIPMYHEHWTEYEEAQLWRRIGKLMGGPAIKIFQNGIFDIHFLAVRSGVIVKPPFDDTMIAHHIQYPEMLKGLEFLVSMYCGAQQHYKDMVKWDNIKENA